MEVVEYRLDPFAALLEGLLEIGIHVAGDSFYAFHPLHPDMVNEVVDDLLLLAVADPEDVAALHVDDVRSVAVPVMQLELIDTKKL